MSYAMAVGAGVSLIGNYMGNRSAKKGAAAQERAEEARRQTAGRGSLAVNQALANEYQTYAPQIRDAMAPKYANVNTGFATTSVDPATGQVSSALNGPWAQQRDMFLRNAGIASAQAPGMFDRGNTYFNDARSQFDKALSFDPQSAARDRYGAAMSLLAPQDATNQQNLMQDLYAKGGFGLTLGTPAAGGGTTALNPYVNAFENSRNQRNAQLSWDSLREGQSLVDSMFNRGATLNTQGGNMFNLGGNMMNIAGQQSNYGAGIERENQNALNQAGNWSQTFTNNNNRQQQAYWDMFMKGRNLNAQGQLDAINTMWGSPSGDAGSGANNRSQMFQGIGNSVGSFIGGGGFNGMFRQSPIGGAAGGGMPAGSAYNIGPADYGMFPGQG